MHFLESKPSNNKSYFTTAFLNKYNNKISDLSHFVWQKKRDRRKVVTIKEIKETRTLIHHMIIKLNWNNNWKCHLTKFDGKILSEWTDWMNLTYIIIIWIRTWNITKSNIRLIEKEIWNNYYEHILKREIHIWNIFENIKRNNIISFTCSIIVCTCTNHLFTHINSNLFKSFYIVALSLYGHLYIMIFFVFHGDHIACKSNGAKKKEKNTAKARLKRSEYFVLSFIK